MGVKGPRVLPKRGHGPREPQDKGVGQLVVSFKVNGFVLLYHIICIVCS